MSRHLPLCAAAAVVSVCAFAAGMNMAGAQTTTAAGTQPAAAPAPIPAVVTGPAAPAAPGASPAPSAPAESAAPAAPAAAPAPTSGDGATTEAAAKPKVPYPSLFFWPDETASLAKAVEDHDHPPASELAAKALAMAEQRAVLEETRPRLPNVYVSAILDFGNGDWTVWANGLRVTPTSQSPLFRVVAVRGNSVDIVVPGNDGGRFMLQPYQTWRSRQKDVVEGIFP